MNIFMPVVFSLPREITKMGFVSSWIMIVAAIFLWVTFVIFGIIAKRFERVLRKRTEWQFILVAPSGILLYAVLKLYSSVIQGNLKMAGSIEIIAYVLFFVSGLLSLLGAFRFRKVVEPKR